MQAEANLSHRSFGPAHLARRFFAVVFARDLAPDEQLWVGERLGDTSGAALFWAQQVPDRRHGHDVARYVSARVPDRPELAIAALLHDVGKRHSALGAFGRTVATLARTLPIPWNSRLALYTRHGPMGAEELHTAGYDGIVVRFAASHHDDQRPVDADPEDWALLMEADHKR